MKNSATPRSALTITPTTSTAKMTLAFRRRAEELAFIEVACLSLCPVLWPLAISSRRTRELDQLGHVEAHFILDDFTQRDVRGAEVGGVCHQRPATAARAGVELADAS